MYRAFACKLCFSLLPGGVCADLFVCLLAGVLVIVWMEYLLVFSFAETGV